jgi:competence ComEA-like helix-hairpin-helix protein
MSTKERHALLLLLTIGLLGHGIRLLSAGPEGSPGAVTLLARSQPVDLALHRAKSARLARPLGPEERIDLNTASFEEIARLPRLGPSLAKAIVRARSERGGIASLAELDSVPGIGPSLLAAITPHVAFGDTNRVRRRDGEKAKRAQSVLPQAPPAPYVLRGPETAGRRGDSGGASERPLVRLNSASALDLDRLPGIGPARAKAIVAYRQSNGPFASVWDLEKVPGMSRRVVRQLAPQVVVP